MEPNFNNFRIDFGKKLRSIRKLKSLSSGDLAISSELSSSAYILSVERGQKDIQLSTIFKLAKGLDVHPKELLDF
ncbi:helix-turn-helix domain-containing protein [Mucilaginibacter terrae]|uniref:helix-turn-helix domain-containing protein n=1 Tax=Mucilaginibacter terrae TaxID=1955052 RepID=UPI0035DE4843